MTSLPDSEAGHPPVSNHKNGSVNANGKSHTNPDKAGDNNNNNDKSVVFKELREIKLNFAVLCFIWIFTFTAYSGLQNLETSLNPGVGNYALAALTGGGTITCLLAPTILDKIGGKPSLVISWLCLMIFVGSNYWPKASLLIPSAFIEGLATGIMWTTQGVYLTTEAVRYAALTGGPLEEVLNTMWGIFGMSFQSTQVWGNLISSVVLQTFNGNTSTPQHTYTCGADMCPDTDSGPSGNGTGSGPGGVTDREYTLISIYMGFTVVGLFLTIFFLKPLKAPPSKAKPPSTKDLLFSTVKFLFSNANMVMLLPLSLYLGVEQTIMFAEFTKNYINCELGIGWIGFAMLCFGITDTIFSGLAGVLAKYLKRPILFFFATVINAAVLVGMLLWTPQADEKYIFFLLPMAWGISDAVWITISAALVSSAFHDKQEPAFANLRMFQALGMAVAYTYHQHLCVTVKLYMCMGLLLLNFVFTTVVEIRIKREKLKQYDELKE